MAKRSVSVMYGRQARTVTVVNFHGVKLDREVELDAEGCDFCGATREYRSTFYSYDDVDWETEGIKAFCNLTCYGGHLASGRTSRARQTRLKRALALLAKIEKDEAREAKKQKPSGRAHLRQVA